MLVDNRVPREGGGHCVIWRKKIGLMTAVLKDGKQK
jgi:hypothetical protein